MITTIKIAPLPELSPLEFASNHFSELVRWWDSNQPSRASSPGFGSLFSQPVLLKAPHVLSSGIGKSLCLPNLTTWLFRKPWMGSARDVGMQRICGFVSTVEQRLDDQDVLATIDTRPERHLLSRKKAARVREFLRRADYVTAMIRAYWATPGAQPKPKPVDTWPLAAVWETYFDPKILADRAARIEARQISAKSYRRPIQFSALAILAASRSCFDRYFSSLSWTQRARRLVTKSGALLYATLEPSGDFARPRLEEVAAA